MSIAKNDEVKRNRSIKIRVSDDELERLNENKSRPELARWLREIGLAGGGGKKEVITHQLPPEMVRLLSGIGSNLNQLAHHVNAANKVGQLDMNAAVLPLLSQLRSTEKALIAVREYLKNVT